MNKHVTVLNRDFLVTITTEDEGYSVDCKSLPGCVSQGDTYEEALENIKEAIAGWLETEAGVEP